MNEEYVYLLTNPCMPEYVKVGRTDNIERRLGELSKDTSVPVPFSCFAYIVIKSGHKVTAASIEKNLHRLLAESMQKNKEFFKTSPGKVLDFFQSIVEINPALKLVICNDSVSSKIEKKRGKPTTFEMLKIPVGAELVYKANSDIRCYVTNDKNGVSYNGKETTVSWIACEIEKLSVNGYDRFVYPASEFPEETLWERRCRLGLLGK